MVMENGRLITCAGPVIERGYVEIKGDKIIAVGEGCYPGGDSERLNVNGAIITPGFVDAHCHLGLWEEGLSFEGDDGNEMTDPCTPHLRAIDAINPLDAAFADALDFGITSIAVGPGSANPVAGQVCAMKTYGKVVDRMLLRQPIAMKFALGENPKTIYNDKSQQPVTRMAVAAIIREQLLKAKRYLQDMEKAVEQEESLPEFDFKCEALQPLLRRKIKAHFHAHRADDICTALRIAEEFHLDAVIIHGTEGYLIPEALKDAGVPVICGPVMANRSKPELRNQTRQNAARLLAAGVPVALMTDAPEVPIEYLGASLAAVVDAGLPESEALSLITIRAAEICGIDHRVGSIAPGKDADLLAFDRSPIGLLVRPVLRMVNGRLLK